MKTQGGFLMSQIKLVSGRLFERILVNAGVSEFNGAQGKILYTLWEFGDMPIVEISKRTGLAKTSLTSMLERMEQAGLITRTVDSDDRRRLVVSLTERARALKGAYDRVSERANEVYYEGFTDAEITEFEGYLRRVLKNLTEVSEKLEKSRGKEE